MCVRPRGDAEHTEIAHVLVVRNVDKQAAARSVKP